MDAILKKYDLKKGTEALQEKFEEELEDWSSEYLDGIIDKKMVLNALAILQGKVCVADFPSVDSPAGSMVKTAFDNISTCVAFSLHDGKVNPKDFYDPLLSFVLNLIGCGPGTTHLTLIREVYLVSGFEEYCHSLRGEPVRQILRACKRQYTTRERIDHQEYAEHVTSNMLHVLQDGFTDQQCEAHRSDFLDLYIAFEFGSYATDEERDMMSTMARWIFIHLDWHPFEGVKDKAVFASVLSSLMKIINDETFPKSPNSVDKIEKGLSMYFKAVNKAGSVTDLYDDIMNVAAKILATKAGNPVHKLVSAIGTFFAEVDGNLVKDNAAMFESMCKKLTQIVEQAKDKTLLGVTFADGIVSGVLANAMGRTPTHAALLIKLVKALIKVPQIRTIKAAELALSGRGRTLNWKEHSDHAKEISEVINNVKIPESADSKGVRKAYSAFAETFLDQTKKARIQSDLNQGSIAFALRVLETKNEDMYDQAFKIVNQTEFDSKKNKDTIMKAFRVVDEALKDDSYGWHENHSLKCLASNLTVMAMRGVKNGRQLTRKDFAVLVSIIKTCIEKDFYHPDTGELEGIYYTLFSHFAPNVLRMLSDMGEMDWAEPLRDGFIDLLDHDSERIREMAAVQVRVMSSNSETVLANDMQKLISAYFDTEKHQVLESIVSLYPENPDPVNDQFQTFMQYHNPGDAMTKSYMLQLYSAVAKQHPELFTEKNLKDLWKNAKKDPLYAPQTLILMENVAKKNPETVGKLLPLLQDDRGLVEHAIPTLMNVFKQVGLKSEKYAESVITHFVKILERPEEQLLFICVLDGMRTVGGKRVHLLTKHKATLEKVKARADIQYTKDGVTALLDLIEGRSLATLSEDIKDTQDDVQELDAKVTVTQKNVKVVTKEVGRQKKEIKTVKKDVKTQGKKIDTLEVTVDETVAKVEEIDGKTLSHAPFWSRDVSKLLNPKGDHDWRLLSTRLGYSNDDIRGWAQQHDPCMAMLNEWYATRKTSEASYAVLTALQEMNRMDAASIVENAMKMADTVVEDEPFEYASPPAVFISYQWGIQNEVKLLKRHLEMAGYECWMDIGQMGGGDKLFEKIDQGIRGSKVIISCVTEKYAKSPNCNREVNLSVSMGRPIIPLLMEKQTWPPAGSMGPIFSEYLFIRFFTRPGEETGDDRYWSVAKFQELLMQLNYNGIVPDEAKVMKEYKKWWIPFVEDIKIDKKRRGNNGDTSQPKSKESAKVAALSPDVFISYQWGKQKQIMLLYRRLTSLGYSCWMDIHQMGGGDSLYDKIDRGVRGCRVILSCITTKYALSANCRREVSLADALKKPIVPLLLEKITWPPSGPMSMVFTQLLYINFSKDESVQEKWTGKEFEEMVGKINKHMPALVERNRNTSPSNRMSTTEAKGTKVIPHQPSKRDEDAHTGPTSQKEPKPHTSSSETQKSKSCTII
ncbi:uncharacterized protein [Haliotis asinina]|uniref:uncharacterized protein n=1 Tax=Haliotis asinina TaxID=109174 RepID=UPI0035319883